MDNAQVKSYAREAEFDTLKEESEEVLNKALKWLSKKILEAREDPSLHFGDFAEHFLTLGIDPTHSNIIQAGEKWKLQRDDQYNQLSDLSQEATQTPLPKPQEVAVTALPHPEPPLSPIYTTTAPSNPAPALQAEQEPEVQPAAAPSSGGFKIPTAKKSVGFVAHGASVPAVSPQQESKAKGASPIVKVSKKSNKPKAPITSGSGGKKVSGAKDKKVKDPNAPKRSPSAYLLFSKDHCDKVKQADSSLSQPQVVKRVAEMWNKATEQDKEPYTTEASSLKEAYQVALAKYQAENPLAAVTAAASSPKASKKKGSKGGEGKKKRKKKAAAKRDDDEDDYDLATEDAKAEMILFPDQNDDDTPEQVKEGEDSAAVSSRGSMRKAGQAARTSMQQLTKLEQSSEIQATTGKEQEDDEQMPVKYGSSKKRGISGPSGSGNTSTRVAQRQKKNIERSNMSATAIPSLSGIKQDNLPSSDDLLHAKIKISQPGEYPEDYTPAKDSYACLVLAPYRDFLQSLTAHPCPVTTDNGGSSEEGPAGTGSDLGTTLASLLGLSNRDLSLIEQITNTASSSTSAAPNVLTNCRVTGLRPLGNCQQKSLSACRFVDLTSTVTTVAGGKDKDTDKDFTILFAPFSSPALTVDPFFLDQTEYDASLQSPWLQIGAQVTRCWASPVETDYGDSGMAIENAEREEGGGEMECVWMEGQVYAIRRDLASDPYQSVSVVWLSQDLEDEEGSWVYAYAQTDNLCSPWDLQPSKYVHPDQHQLSKRAALPRSLTVGHLQAASILDYVSSWDAASVFRYDLSKQAKKEFLHMFPDERDRLDLNIITEWAAQGRYDGSATTSSSSSSSSSGGGGGSPHSMGIATLFRDLERMVQTGLRFNDCNSSFLPWRQAEMTQQALHDLKLKLSKAHPSLSCLRTAVQEDAKLAYNKEMTQSRDVMEV